MSSNPSEGLVPSARLTNLPAVLALDVGGTKMAAAIVGPDHTLLAEARTPTPQGGDAESVFDAAVFVLKAVLTEARTRIGALGVGCGGPMRWPSGDVSPLNIPAWRNFPLRDRLAEAFGLPVRLHNDAICLTVGEHLAGAGRGVANVLGMVVSTGVGGGLILDGRLVDGFSGNAGHIGHVVVDPAGPPCLCGGVGCLEAVARGPALVAWAQQRGWRGGAGGADLADAARAGDPVALAAFRRCGEAVGTAIASAAALTDLEVVAVGGGVSHAADLVLPAVFDGFERHAGFEFVRECRIVLAAQGAALVGAAGLFTAGDRYWHGDIARVPESRMNPSS